MSGHKTDRRSNRQRFREDFREETGYEWHPWRWFFGAVAVFLVVYLTLIAFTAVTMPFRSALGVGERVSNPDNVIFQYEKFHDLCAGIAAKDQQRATAAKAAAAFDKRTAGKDDPLGRNAEESARLHQVADGILLARQQDAQRYNADSRKFTQNLFKSKGLPYRIDDGVTPNCDAQP
jgi:hypothetical protein